MVVEYKISLLVRSLIVFILFNKQVANFQSSTESAIIFNVEFQRAGLPVDELIPTSVVKEAPKHMFVNEGQPQ